MIEKQKYVEKIKALHEKKTGKKISDLEALDIFENLITLVSSIYKPIPRNYEK